MARSQRIAAIDLGTTKIACLIAEVSHPNKINVIGLADSQTQGFTQGCVNNLDKAVESVSIACENACRQANKRLKGMPVYVGIKGDYLKFIQGVGAVPVKKPSKGIQERDIQKALEQAQAIRLPPEEQILYSIPTQFTVDGQKGIRNPLGLFGVRLEIDTLMIIAAVTVLENIYRVFDRLGIRIQGLVLQSLAESFTICEPEEKNLGVVILDIGGVTDLSIFKDGELRFFKTLNFGGIHITKDIAVGLRIPFNQAEIIKRQWGVALVTKVQKDEPIVLEEQGNFKRNVSRRQLASIIEPRVEEILLHAEAEVRKSGFAESLPSGVVLTGGVSNMPGIREQAEQIFGLPVKIGIPQGTNGYSELVADPIYAGLVGLVRYGLEGKYFHTRETPGFFRNLWDEIKSWFS